MHSTSEIRGDKFVIGTKSLIAKNIIDDTDVKLAVKETAEKMLGRPIQVVVEDFKADSGDKEDKLDSLRRFGNIRFE